MSEFIFRYQHNSGIRTLVLTFQKMLFLTCFQATSPNTIIKSFASSGIWPIDIEKIDFARCKPAEVFTLIYYSFIFEKQASKTIRNSPDN